MNELELKIIKSFEREGFKSPFSKGILTKDESDSLSWLSSKHVDSIDGEFLEEHSDSIYLISPLNFQSLLPIVMRVSLIEKERDLLMVHSIISMLDISLDERLWSDFFKDRFTSLKAVEYDAILEWLLWLDEEPSGLSNVSIARGFDVITYLRDGSHKPV